MFTSTNSRSTLLGRLEVMAAAAIFLIAGSVFAQNYKSISTILNADGTIKAAAASGSFDARGYRMVVSSSGTPRFRRAAASPSDANWDPAFTVAGVGGYVDVVTHNGDTLYVGGNFGSAGRVVLNNIAKYDLATNSWSAFDSTSADLGVNGEVFSILVNGTDVYIGGSFSDAGGVAANNIVDYNTATGKWSTLGTGTSNGVDNQVNCMVYFGGNLYVGGEFANAGGSPASYVARWDGTAWHSLGAGVDNNVWALTVYNGLLYTGGDFLNAGGSAADYIAKWDGTSWSTVGVSATDLNGSVYALLGTSNALYVGGVFTKAGAATVNSITKWSGTSWNTVGTGVNSGVTSITQSGANLYVSGSFTSAGLITVNSIAVVDTATNTWSPLGSTSIIGTNAYTSGCTIVNGVLYTGGGFTIAGAINAVGIAGWNGTSWSSLGGTTDVPSGVVFAVALSGSTIYVGGSFLTAGNVTANNIAAYNTSTHVWSSLGAGTSAGVNGTVDAIAIMSGDVYVGGAFSAAGGSPANHIAMWNGSIWSTLGTTPKDGLSGYVNALASFGTDLYAGGAFTTTGSGLTVNHVAKWSGTSWSALGSGVNGTVDAIAPGTTQIYVGGGFTTAGGSSAAHIASWNGVNWSALGSPTNGVDNTVKAVYTIGDTVYVGGYFLNAGGSSANHLAKWNTHQWTDLGTGVGGPVFGISGSGTNLYLAGSFSTSGLVNASNVIDWNIADSSFITLGSGTNGMALAVLADSTSIYFGGNFSAAGDKPSYRFARYSLNGITAVEEGNAVAKSFELMQNYPNPFNPTTVINYQLSAVDHVTLRVYDILGREVTTLVDGVQTPGEHSVVFDASRFASGVYFYRLISGNSVITRKMMLIK